MTSSDYKTSLVPNFMEHIGGKYKVLDILTSLAITIVISFWTVMARTDYDMDATMRFFEPEIVAVLLKSILAFFVIRKVRLLIKNM